MADKNKDQVAKGDTIYALSSGAARAGVAVIRMSGSECEAVLAAMTGSRVPEPRYAALRKLRDLRDGAVLDEALVFWFPGPKSFTGEDMAELHLHGGRAIVAAMLDVLGAFDGLRMAEPGEFTRRAFDNGKLDLTVAEGLADLIDAQTEAQRRQALRQADGALMSIYDGWRAKLIYSLAMTEAALDFSDEGDVPGEVATKVRPDIEKLVSELKAHLDDGHRGEILRDGFQVVLAGPTNAGKSSLLNALARRDAAIVSDEAGTTRDVIEVRLDLGGYPVIVTDTAGFREAEGAIEREGIRRSIGEARKADLILWLVPPDIADMPVPPDLKNETHKILRVLNKADLVPGMAKPEGIDAVISAKTGAGIDALTKWLTDEAAARIGSFENPAISNARQRRELETCFEALEAYLVGKSSDIELRAEDLRVAARALGRITGRVDVEDVLDAIFSSFCIGK